MITDAGQTIVRTLDRINLRLTADMLRMIDVARSKRPGNVSRNTWIVEAIEERFAREANQLATGTTERAAND